MADDAAERLRQHEDLLRSFTAMLAAQHVMNERQLALNERQAAINADIRTTLDRMEMTQARVETLLTRLLRHETNGTDA